MDFLSPELIELGSAGVLLALFLGTFVSEDLACIAAGSLIAADRIDPTASVLACFAGIVVGDLLLFSAGRLFGARFLASSVASRFVTPQAVDRASEWLAARGTSAIFFSRFVSGLRLPTYFLSGVLRLDAKRFTLLVAVGAAAWTPVIVLASAFWNTTVPFGGMAAAIGFFFLFRSVFRLTDPRRRRLLSGKLKRIRRWEFWPLWFFYIPVVAYVIFLAIRFRGLHFTAANPGMPAGGFVGESKDAIYKLIGRSADTHGRLLLHARIPAADSVADRYRQAADFIETNKLSFPVVVKPDAGERGNGVKVVHNVSDLEGTLTDVNTDVLIQEYVAGVEASVFYYRYPGEAHGRIFSITEKVFPFITGDGISTVEDLILTDPRAHIIAESYFKRNESRLSHIPPPGEKVALVDIGTHSKGAIFSDGSWMRTRELETAIDDLSRGIPGFYFGRYDLRAESFAKLSSGNFKIIELNGVTSESTNIYDPKFSLIDAYKILFRQWRLAFDIGRENRARGAAVSTPAQLLRLIAS